MLAWITSQCKERQAFSWLGLPDISFKCGAVETGSF